MSTVKTNNVQVGQSGTATNNFTLYQPTSPDGTVRLGVGNSGATTADVLIANSGGTVGVGVTPNTWGSPITKAFQVGNASVSNYSGETNCYLTGNAYYNSGWKYVVTKAASMYQFEGLNHTWSSAASGTAGTAITFTDVLAVSKDKSLALQGATTQSGAGITFPATQSASSDANTLDDYEQGTWTPVTKLGTTTQTASNALGAYTKIGNVVYFACQTGDLTKSGTGSLTISLPFTASSTGSLNRSSQALVRWNGINPGGVVIGYIDPGTATVSLQWFTTTGGYGGAVDNTHCSATYQLYGVSGFFYMD